MKIDEIAYDIFMSDVKKSDVSNEVGDYLRCITIQEFSDRKYNYGYYKYYELAKIELRKQKIIKLNKI